MLTTSRAAQLLASTTDYDSLRALLSPLGFGEPIPLDAALARRIGVSTTKPRPWIASGMGTLRCLIAAVGSNGSARDETIRLARTLLRNAPEPSWLLVARDALSGQIIIAAPPPAQLGPIPAIAIAPSQVHESDAETFASLCAVRETSDLLTHLRWRETLGRDALTRRFYRELESRVSAMAASASGHAPDEARRTIALLHTSRLLFLAFLEARGWLDGNREFLREHFLARCGGRGAHNRFLAPLWFGTLNTPVSKRAASARAFGRVPFLNGGLFARSPIERRYHTLRLSDESIASIIGDLFARYRLTAHESTSGWSDAAVDPEMLGRAFESLMQADTRRHQGAFYTPPQLLTELTRGGLQQALASLGVSPSLSERAWAGEALTRDEGEQLAKAATRLRVLDPACGSGAFLVSALEEITRLRRLASDAPTLRGLRRQVLTESIFGVDINPTAVWLCQLRLWLSVVVDEPDTDPLRIAALPNLDRNVREGDALAGPDFSDARLPYDPSLARRRLQYTRASGARKQTLARVLDREERGRAIASCTTRLIALTERRRSLLTAARSRDLFARRHPPTAGIRAELLAVRAELRQLTRQRESLRLGAALPFSFPTHFADVATQRGFTLILGNPPWVRTHAIDPRQRASLRERFRVFRAAAWEAGAADAAAGRGFAGQVDLAALFVERAVQLTAPGGALALLLPAKLWGSLAGGGLRALLDTDAAPVRIMDWSESNAGFDAVVYPSALIARRHSERPPAVRVTVHRHGIPLTWDTPTDTLALDPSAGAPWLLLPPEVRAAFEAIAEAGTPLARSAIGRPLLGVKSGCNEAFVLAAAEARRLHIERDCLRPLLKGEDVSAWWAADPEHRDAIVWTHDARGLPRERLPAAAHARLLPWRRRLEMRSDAKRGRWWALFRTEAARSDRPRVVWGDIGKRPRALVLPADDPTVPLNTCYVARTPTLEDAHTLAALLNSSLAAAWLGAIAEPARGGYRRFLGWTCARLPLPQDWSRARRVLAPLGQTAMAGQPPDEWTLLEAVLEAFDLEHATVAPLLSWHSL